MKDLDQKKKKAILILGSTLLPAVKKTKYCGNPGNPFFWWWDRSFNPAGIRSLFLMRSFLYIYGASHKDFDTYKFQKFAQAEEFCMC